MIPGVYIYTLEGNTRTHFLPKFMTLNVEIRELLIIVLHVCNVLVGDTIFWSIYVLMLIFRLDMNGWLDGN